MTGRRIAVSTVEADMARIHRGKMGYNNPIPSKPANWALKPPAKPNKVRHKPPNVKR